MRILLTGAHGFIGTHVWPHLLNAGHDIVTIGRSLPQTRDARLTFIQADLLVPGEAERVAVHVKADMLVHLAWTVEHGKFWADPANLDWVAASLLLARAVAEQGARRIVMAGTCFEYDWPANDDCDETSTPLAGHTLYDIAKNAVRSTLEPWARSAGLSFAWGRLFYLYGASEHPARLVADVSQCVAQGRPAECSSGLVRRDFMDVRDAGAALAALALSDVSGSVNIATGEAPPIADIAHLIGKIAQRPDLIRLGARPDRVGEPPRIAANVARLRNEVGFTPRIALREGLAEAFGFWRSLEQRRILEGSVTGINGTAPGLPDASVDGQAASVPAVDLTHRRRDTVMQQSAEMPLVSIALPTFNRPDGLEVALKSLRAQTYRNLEIIVSDNASDDPRVAEVIRFHQEADDRVKLIRRSVNIGMLQNFKQAMEATSGPLVMWAADDDYWYPTFVERLVDVLQAHPEAGLAFGGLEEVNLDGVIVARNTGLSRHNSSSDKILDLKRFLDETETAGKANIVMGLFRREALLDVVARVWNRTDFRWADDVVLLFAFLARSRLVCISEVLYRKSRRTRKTRWNHRQPLWYTGGIPLREHASFAHRLELAVDDEAHKRLVRTVMRRRWLHELLIAKAGRAIVKLWYRITWGARSDARRPET